MMKSPAAAGRTPLSAGRTTVIQGALEATTAGWGTVFMGTFAAREKGANRNAKTVDANTRGFYNFGFPGSAQKKVPKKMRRRRGFAAAKSMTITPDSISASVWRKRSLKVVASARPAPRLLSRSRSPPA